MVVKEVLQKESLIIRSASRIVDLPLKKADLQIIEDLVDSMRYHGLVGMAAPQIGQSVRIFVVEVRGEKRLFRERKSIIPLRIYVNPIIISRSRKEQWDFEGCGSVEYKNLRAKVRRSKQLKICAFDENGRYFAESVKNPYYARIIQHELDHLDGKVFLDRMYDPKSLMTAKGKPVKL